MEVFLNDKFVPVENAMISVADHGFLYGDGVYETLRTYGGKVGDLKSHLERLRSGMEIMRLPLRWSDDELKGWIEEGIRRNGFKETRIRVTVSRGENGFRITDVKNPTLLISFASLEEIKREGGGSAITFEIERSLPRVKTLGMTGVMVARAEMEEKGADEVILIDREGFLREGSVTNVFVVKDGVIMTPRERVLAGTMRQKVLDLAREAGIGVEEREITKEELLGADEVFVTNAIRGIVAVREIDGKRIGGGEVENGLGTGATGGAMGGAMGGSTGGRTGVAEKLNADFRIFLEKFNE